MRISLIAALVAIAGSVGLSTPAVAAGVVANPSQLSPVMKKAGYTVEQKSEGAEIWLRASNGKESYPFSVLFYGCDDKTTANCKSVQFYSNFTPKKKLTLEAMNDYARDNRWGRIYIDKQSNAVIEMDVDMEDGGMSEALYLDNLEYFEAMMDRFATFVFKE